ncbi:MAG TPA: hypothetical protein VK779_10055, partial [Rhizomicrobium sp.]|nr:hypothetical protein [Rhizomicrobium sp.]
MNDKTDKPPVPEANEFVPTDAGEFARNMMRVGQQSQRLLADFARRQAEKIGSHEPLDPLNITTAFMELARAMAANPAVLVDASFALWRDYMTLWENTARRMMGDETVKPVIAPRPGDKRFRDKDWQENQIFDFIKQSYLLTANCLQSTTAKLEGIDPQMQQRVTFYTRQFADAIAPTNFVLTNPEVLRTTMQTNGENLVKGLDNLLDDLDRGHGQLSIRQSSDAFVI